MHGMRRGAPTHFKYDPAETHTVTDGRESAHCPACSDDRLTALYGFKQSILETLIGEGCIDAVDRHEIDGREYYCLSVGDFSFHSPVTEWDEPPADDVPATAETLDSFDSTAESRSDALSEREALTRLEAFGSPNHHLPTPFVDSGYRSRFAGWSGLPGAIEEGDRVDRPVEHCEPFLFAVGDEFDTERGRCRIRDRHRAWLSPLRDRSPVCPRPAYDLLLDGERHDTVRQRRLIDDWYVLADSLDDPLPDADGEQAERAGSAYGGPVPFEVGDVVEVEPDWDDDGPYYWRITRAFVSHTLLLCEFEPVGPTDHCEPSLALEEFADDVVASYDSPDDIGHDSPGDA
ncbi:hypothetical protein HSBGL_0470 [Halapricum desulfuricans]|uniref:Uncharacterized protein n=1 Tax=Halapricum desulfuricans TaxID=2841257 RepID=A0A897NHJ2_9EURY|nr:hypothetical protein HSBGL_0470 [Halapricum desulfuricans]